MGWGEFPGSRVHTDGEHKEVYGGGRSIAQKICVRAIKVMRNYGTKIQKTRYLTLYFFYLEVSVDSKGHHC